MKIPHVRKRSTAAHLQKVDCMTMKLQLSSFHFIKSEPIGLGYQLFLNNKKFYAWSFRIKQKQRNKNFLGTATLQIGFYHYTLL